MTYAELASITLRLHNAQRHFDMLLGFARQDREALARHWQGYQACPFPAMRTTYRRLMERRLANYDETLKQAAHIALVSGRV